MRSCGCHPTGRVWRPSVLDGDRDLWVIGLDGSSVQKLTSGPPGTGCRSGRRRVGDLLHHCRSATSTAFRPTAPPARKRFSSSPSRIGCIRCRSHRMGNACSCSGTSCPNSKTFACSSSGATPQLTPLIGQSGTEGDGQLSPDGQWIVYQSAESTGGGATARSWSGHSPTLTRTAGSFRRALAASRSGRTTVARSSIAPRTARVMSVSDQSHAEPAFFRPRPARSCHQPGEHASRLGQGPPMTCLRTAGVFSSSRHRSSTSGPST